MESENIFTILQRNHLSCTGLNYGLYEELSQQSLTEEEIVIKIKAYENYIENTENKYSEMIMQYLRQRNGLSKYDYSKDSKLNQLSSDTVFKEVIEWNGLLGGWDCTIKNWIKEIYDIDLDEIKEKKQII